MRKENSTNQLNEKAITNNCPVTSTFQAIGGRWKITILLRLKNGALRYNEIQKSIPHISEKMLIQQLKELMQSGWVDKRELNEISPRTEYCLTAMGASFIPIIEGIYEWGIEHNIVEKG
jgi:DNA-binding HxlR family transcriptional regulator